MHCPGPAYTRGQAAGTGCECVPQLNNGALANVRAEAGADQDRTGHRRCLQNTEKHGANRLARKALPPQLQPYWQYHQDLLVVDGLLMKGKRLDMLNKIQEGHQGITKCVARAQQSMGWLGLTKQIKQIVENCAICARGAHGAPEPLLTTLLPDRPWQRVAADLFQWDNAMYLVIVDYYSRYIEVANIISTTTAYVKGKMKSIFARPAVPEITDNGPQFFAAEFTALARDYDFTHTTSSPRYPQSNGEADRAVKTVKFLLKKGEDPHKALMAYRATPLSHGSSPAQLLMGRNIRTCQPREATAGMA